MEARGAEERAAILRASKEKTGKRGFWTRRGVDEAWTVFAPYPIEGGVRVGNLGREIVEALLATPASPGAEPHRGHRCGGIPVRRKEPEEADESERYPSLNTGGM